MRRVLRLAVASVLLLAAGPAEKGVLHLQSQPGAEVEWEGVILGETDGRGILLIRDIPPGEYRLTVRKAGFRSATTQVSVTPGETALTLRLEPIPPPPPPRKPPEPVRAAPPAPAPEPAPPTPAEPPAQEAKPPVEAEPEPAEPVSEPAEPRLEAAAAQPEGAASDPGAGAPSLLGWALPAARAVALLAIMLLALLLAVALWFRLRAQQPLRVQSNTTGGRQKPAERKQRAPLPASKQSSWFLEELRQREASTASKDSSEGRTGEKEVIEVTDFEIVEEDT